MWVANFLFSISSWVCPKISWKRGRKIIIRRRRRSHNNNNEGITIRKAYCMIHRLPDTVVLTNPKPLYYAIINNLKTYPPLEYATIKFTLLTPALDNAIKKI